MTTSDHNYEGPHCPMSDKYSQWQCLYVQYCWLINQMGETWRHSVYMCTGIHWNVLQQAVAKVCEAYSFSPLFACNILLQYSPFQMVASLLMMMMVMVVLLLPLRVGQ